MLNPTPQFMPECGLGWWMFSLNFRFWKFWNEKNSKLGNSEFGIFWNLEILFWGERKLEVLWWWVEKMVTKWQVFLFKMLKKWQVSDKLKKCWKSDKLVASWEKCWKKWQVRDKLEKVLTKWQVSDKLEKVLKKWQVSDKLGKVLWLQDKKKLPKS